jgi:putative glutamine amidotransferase
MRPIIGIATSVDVNRHSMVINSLPIAYSTAVEKAGGLPLVLPFSKDQAMLHLMVQRVDGLLLPGGIDLDPSWFNEAPASGLEAVDRDLDVFQLALFQAAFSSQKPVLGICRGCQLINVALAGNLFQDIYSQRPTPPLPHRGQGHDSEHLVTIMAGSRLAALLGAEVMVNSRHHQAIKDVGQDLWVTAIAPDGVIEAAEHRSLPIQLVQWHPERMLMKDNLMLPLFANFVDQCR